MHNYLILVFGLAFLLPALYLLWKQVIVRKNGVRTIGVVIDVKATDSEAGYRPIVQFTTTDGQQIVWKSSNTSSHWKNIKGEPWPVIYDSRNPQNAIADNGNHLVLITICGLISIVCLIGFIR